MIKEWLKKYDINCEVLRNIIEVLKPRNLTTISLSSANECIRQINENFKQLNQYDIYVKVKELKDRTIYSVDVKIMDYETVYEVMCPSISLHGLLESVTRLITKLIYSSVELDIFNEVEYKVSVPCGKYGSSKSTTVVITSEHSHTPKLTLTGNTLIIGLNYANLNSVGQLSTLYLMVRKNLNDIIDNMFLRALRVYLGLEPLNYTFKDFNVDFVMDSSSAIYAHFIEYIYNGYKVYIPDCSGTGFNSYGVAVTESMVLPKKDRDNIYDIVYKINEMIGVV